MNRNEQIEEMAYRIFGNSITHDTAFREDCRSIATDLYEAGYRKASEVAKEIFAELKTVMIDEWRYPIIAALKKKYLEVDENDDI